jgi:hypothetical protein
MDPHVVPRVHVGLAVGNRDLHRGVGLQMVDQHRSAQWQGAISRGKFVP